MGRGHVPTQTNGQTLRLLERIGLSADSLKIIYNKTMLYFKTNVLDKLDKYPIYWGENQQIGQSYLNDLTRFWPYRKKYMTKQFNRFMNS